MTFTVEVLLKGRKGVVTESVEHDVAADAWTDDDVRTVLHLTLSELARAHNPGDEPPPTHLRGFSWIVTSLDQGVAIAIETASGAVVSGPFELDQDWLTQSIARVMARPTETPERVH